MKIKQNDMEYLIDSVKKGIIDADTANIENVRMRRVFMVTKIPSSVRRALNSAVKKGYLSHMKKDHLLPEVYYHPDFEYLATSERKQYMIDVSKNIMKTLCN